jgi:hypothetical protein
MADIKQITFTHQEIAEILVKKQDIHDGFWGIFLELGLSAGVVPTTPDGSTVTPAGIVLINRIGILKFDQPNPLTIDAAKTTPAPKPSAGATD